VAAPRGNSWNDGRNLFLAKAAKRSMFDDVTRWREEFRGGYNMRQGPLLVEMCEIRQAKYIKDARDDAAMQYDLYVMKLCGKCGEVDAAEIEGNHIWFSSSLAITKPDGTRELWITKMIHNRSKLGRSFLQWPTRKAK
jgi:hypothetical protein